MRLNLDDSRTQLNDIDEEGYTALHYAARYNRLEVVEVLVKAGTGLSVALVRPPPAPAASYVSLHRQRSSAALTYCIETANDIVELFHRLVVPSV